MVYKFNILDTNIVLDVNSGIIHEFDCVSMDVLDIIIKSGIMYKSLEESNINDFDFSSLYIKYQKSQIEESFDEIKVLIKNKSLFTSGEILEEINSVQTKNEVKALCLHIAHDCNLKCSYCFASCGDYKVKRSLMSKEVGTAAIDFVIKNSGNRKNIEVDFFGGEPLLNFQVVKDVVKYARGKEKEFNKNFRFTITTNALLLDEDKMDFINENMDNIVLSIDGRENINDNMRKTIDNRGSYKYILPKIQEMVSKRGNKSHYIRGTFTRHNLDFSKDVLHLADLGFKELSIEPVVTDLNLGFDIREEDLPVIFQEYETLAKEYVRRKKEGNGFNFFHFMVDLEGGPCAAKRMYGCGAGFDYVAVTPEGDIYPCHQFVGTDGFLVGNIFEGIKNRTISDMFIENNIYSKDECNQCWSKFFCSGGCSANAYMFSKNIKKPYNIACQLQKKRIECALWIKTQI